MSFIIAGLDREEFAPLFSLSDEELKRRGVVRKTATSKPGFPCRITLEDAEPHIAYIHAHIAAHGCFAAEIRRAV